jgi:DNA-binding protein H-NS|tara:strand:+ start:59027 stop:59443 length:417 start_codon:yes stop_codon:yes gene_type:complete
VKKEEIKKALSSKKKLTSVIELFEERELSQLQTRLDDVISSVMESRRAEALQRQQREQKANELLQQAKEQGVDLSDLLAAAGISETDLKKDLRRSAGGRKKKVKYRLGDNEWTGAGRKPRWVKELEENGVDIEEYRVN